MESDKSRDDAELDALAAALDCFTERQFQILTGWTPETAKAYRKRGEGPLAIRFGRNYFYPRKRTAEYVHSLIRERKAPNAKGML